MSIDVNSDSFTASDDFQALREHFQEVIEDFDSSFTSHQFILELARRHQAEYVRALSRCLEDEQAPFRKLHQAIARNLRTFSHLIERRPDIESEDIFRQRRICATWRKKGQGEE